VTGRILLLCLAFACAHGAPDNPDGATRTAPRAGRGGGGDDAGVAEDETAGCAADKDCAFTRVPAGGCCPMLCEPRAVTRKRAEMLEAAIGRCSDSGQCPQPLCRPPSETFVAACVKNRCVARSAGTQN
jgi:hypothetical protein